jgi:hypothetical protein
MGLQYAFRHTVSVCAGKRKGGGGLFNWSAIVRTDRIRGSSLAKSVGELGS